MNKKTHLGFYIKPIMRVGQKEENDFKMIFSKEYEKVSIHITAEGICIIEMHKGYIKSDSTLEGYMEKVDNASFYTGYANVVYLLFKNSFDKITKDLKLNIQRIILYDVVDDESIVVSKNVTLWEKEIAKGDCYGRTSYNNFCFINDIGPFENNITNEAFNEISVSFCHDLDIAMSDKNLLQILLLLQKSFISIINGQFDVSIILSWTVIETTINCMWKKMIEEKIIDKKKKTFIINSQDYHVDPMLNMLCMEDILTDKEINDINTVKKKRNKIVHGKYNLFDETGQMNGKYTNMLQEAQKSNLIARHIIKKYCSIDIELEYSLNVQIY